VVARDAETGREFELPARVVVNATGVFTDAIRRLDEPATPPLIAPSQGAHIVLDKSFLPGDSAIMVPKTDDHRVLFAIPWRDRVLIGTTDTPVAQADLEPRPLPEEIGFLLTHAARYLTKDPKRADVLSAFAGLRPLVKSVAGQDTASVPRDHSVVVSKSGLVTITGGKWTTYRKMAEDTIGQAALVGELEERPCATAQLKLHGWRAREAGKRPWDDYGTDAFALQALVEENRALDGPLHPRLPYRAVEVVWAARHEMARTVEDVLSRRTRALLLDARASIEAAPAVARLMAAELKRDARWVESQVAAYQKLAAGYLVG
jgi:glycerol-3-phosphate dehydrogenase